VTGNIGSDAIEGSRASGSLADARHIVSRQRRIRGINCRGQTTDRDEGQGEEGEPQLH
jgi:hypothetical protein